MTMAKSILFNAVEYAILQEPAKRERLKPDHYLKRILREAYARLK
jgi:hypothetical protein